MLSTLVRRPGTSALVNSAFRQIYTGNCAAVVYSAQPSALQQQAQRLAKDELRTHYERIAATTRPISPHLSIYVMEPHMFMSLMNRATGCYMACVFIGFGGMSLIMPDWFSQGSLLLAGLPPLCTTFIKFCISFPFGIHLGNGLRHLAHDFGYMLGRKQLLSAQVITLAFATAFGVGWALYTIK